MPRPGKLKKLRLEAKSNYIKASTKAEHLHSEEVLKKKVQSRLILQAFKTGNLRYKLLPHQEQMYDKIRNTPPGRKCVVNCSRRFGKSTVLCIRAVEQCVSKPNSTVVFLCLSSKQSRQIVEPILQFICSDIPPKYKPAFNQNAGTFVFSHNGSRIILGSATDRNEEGLRGVTADLVIVDEAASVDNLQYIISSILLPATLTTNAPIIIASTPAVTPDSYFTELCRHAELEGYYSCFTIYDNTSLSPEKIEQYCQESGGRKSTTWLREYMCHFVTETTCVVVPEWQEIFEYSPPKDEFYKYYHKYIAMDLGVRDKTMILFGYYDFKNARLVIEDEIDISGIEVTTQKIYEKTRSKESELWGKEAYKRISDSNNLILLQDLASLHDYHFIPTAKNELEAQINELRMLVNSGKLIVNPECKQTIGCLRYATWNAKRTQFTRSATYGHYDSLSALIYLVRNLDKYINPIPSTFDRFNMDGDFTEDYRLSPNARLLKKLFTPT